MFSFNTTAIDGLYIITLPNFKDERGGFTKVFNNDLFQQNHINFKLEECYFSLSEKGVVRGMHFQLPPFQHAKIVCCPYGAIEDVVVDLRKDSKTFGQCVSNVLSADNHQAFYIPEGMAHGFKSLQDGSITQYLVSSGYEQSSDTGILYSSIGFDWQIENPIVSERDKQFETLKSFKSPF